MHKDDSKSLCLKGLHNVVGHQNQARIWPELDIKNRVKFSTTLYHILFYNFMKIS